MKNTKEPSKVVEK